MRTSILFTIAAAVFGSAASAQDFGDDIAFSLHHTKSDNLHFKTREGTNNVNPNAADKTAQAIYLIGVGPKVKFEWSPDTTKVAIQDCTAWFSADPGLANVKWDLGDGAGAVKPADKQNPKRLPVAGSTHVECEAKA